MPKSPLLRIYCVWMIFDLLALIVYGNVIQQFLSLNNEWIGESLMAALLGLFTAQFQMFGISLTVLLYRRSWTGLLSLIPLVLTYWLLPETWWSPAESGQIIGIILYVLLLVSAAIILWAPFIGLSANDYFIVRTESRMIQFALKSQFSLLSLFYFTTIIALICGAWRIAKILEIVLILEPILSYILPVTVIIAYLRNKFDYITLALTSVLIFMIGFPLAYSMTPDSFPVTSFLATQFVALFFTCMALRFYGYRIQREPWPQIWQNSPPDYTSVD